MTNISRSINQKLGTLSGVLLVLLLSLTGCQKERFVPEEDLGYRHTAEFDEGSTYMSLAIRTTPPTTDPATQQEAGAKDGKESATGEESFTTWQGDDIIENFAVYIVSEGIDKVQCIAGSVTDSSLATWDPDKQELLLNPFRSAPVSKRIFAFFNIPTQYQNYLGEKLNNKKEFLERISEPIPYVGEQGITYDGDAPLLEAFRPDSHIATKEIATGPSAMVPDVPSFTAVGRSGYDAKRPRLHLDFPNEFFDALMTSEAKPRPLQCTKREDRILSSGARYNYLPEDNITEEEVKDGRNLVQVYTRRVLAQAVVTTEAALVNTPITELGGMVIKGVSFQVLNFEPTFFPIARTTKEGDWPGNKNTVTPLYDQTDNSSRINMTTYQSTIADEEFTADALVRDRFFRSAHFVYGEEPAELDPTDKDYAQKLLREVRMEYKGNKKLYDGKAIEDIGVPVHGTTFWGSCYVTESTHKWGTDGASGYTTSNTPFYAVVAYFDTEKLPWADASRDAGVAKNGDDEKRYREAVKDLEEELAKVEAELKKLEKEQGEQGDNTEALWTEAQNKFEEWRSKVDKYNKELKNPNKNVDRQLGNIVRWRTFYRNGEKKMTNRAAFDKKIKYILSTLKDEFLKALKKEYKYEFKYRSKYDDLFGSDDNGGLWKEIKDIDEKREGGGGIANKIAELKKESSRLKLEMEKIRNSVLPSDKWYAKDEVTKRNREFYTPFIYEQGINRIFYSQVDHKFYLNYHEISKENRGNATHNLEADKSWLTELENNLPNGKKFPTKANGAPAEAAVLEPTQELLDKLSQLLNGEIKETKLNPAERRSMDFYLYGRVAPGLIQYFDSKKDRTDRIDLQLGYVAWYSAKGSDRVVSYPCYIRYRNEAKSGIHDARLLMVYYSWLNPNTSDPSNSYASPVLRNNIYHMHITGFTKMGLSAIPFVPRVPEGNGYKFLHWKLDPDEEVPAANAPLNATSGTGSPTSLSTPRSSSFSLTF
ncbi:fimbria major subunit [uncultured Porphyromonas sp.]|uniref:fimbria major subunit n=1 Tax=uncultured Porphyromonas sp. TaxID=159274 RepID=UPI0025838604|nr:fimbria major subunit [uncultured Porphyromonas sp.]